MADCLFVFSLFVDYATSALHLHVSAEGPIIVLTRAGIIRLEFDSVTHTTTVLSLLGSYRLTENSIGEIEDVWEWYQVSTRETRVECKKFYYLYMYHTQK